MLFYSHFATQIYGLIRFIVNKTAITPSLFSPLHGYLIYYFPRVIIKNIKKLAILLK